MNTVDTLRKFVLEEIVRSPSLELTETDQLIERGYMTSLDVVQLLVFIDEQFGLEVDPEDVTETNFQSLASIAQLIDAAGNARST